VCFAIFGRFLGFGGKQFSIPNGKIVVLNSVRIDGITNRKLPLSRDRSTGSMTQD
jgi:hypothetical protein